MENQTPAPGMGNNTTVPVYPQPAPQKPKGGRAKYIIGALVGVVVIAACICVALSFYNKSTREKLAYEALENNEMVQDYEGFLTDYPDSKYAPEVKERLAKLQEMLQKWAQIALSDRVADFEAFKQAYTSANYTNLCNIKIDSLDFVAAQKAGTEEAYRKYLAAHPEGRYASDASVAQGQIRDREVSVSDREQIISVITAFYNAFAAQDDKVVCENIAASMKTFLHQKDVNKVQVMNTIHAMFNEHIQGCTFTVNRDFQIERITSVRDDEAAYTVSFTVDQHIERDNDGKTFGQYRCTAEMSPSLLVTSLTMDELSKQ